MKAKMVAAAAVVVIATFAGCGSSSTRAQEQSPASKAEKACREAVADKFNDPLSVQFRKIRVDPTGDEAQFVIGELNAKNGLGVYKGFKEFSCTWTPMYGVGDVNLGIYGLLG